MSKSTQLQDPVTKEKIYPVTTTDCIYLPDGSSLTNHLNKSHLPLGLIIPSAIVQNDAGLRLLDGSSLSINGVYKAFCDYLVARYTEDNTSVPVCSIEEYANDMNKYGQCAKFVYNNTSSELISGFGGTTYIVAPYSIKLPTITKHIEGLSSISELGKALGAGLPNITGSYSRGTPSENTVNQSYKPTGAFAETDTQSTQSAKMMANSSSNYTGYTALKFSAQRSNSIYGNSNTVQTQSVKYPYYIVVATTTKTDIEVNIDNIASDLNNVLSQINTKISKNEIARYPVSTWISSDKLTWYIIYNDGWKECGGHVVLSATNNWQQPTVIFPIPFDIAPISLLINVKLATYQDGAMYGQITSYSNTQFVTGIYSATNRNEFFWSACGY